MLTLTPLQQMYDQLKESDPKIRIRDAAKKLQVSELELLELGLEKHVIRLKGDWKTLIGELHEVDRVMALTRNEYVVHERKGIYNNISFFKKGDMGVAVNEDIDLRFFMKEWVHAYAVRMVKSKQTLHSLQFFNAAGEAVHKIYLTSKSNPLAFEKLLKKYTAKAQNQRVAVKKKKEKEKSDLTLSLEDQSRFQMEWLQLKDTHDFYPLINKYNLNRLQALQIAPKGYAQRISQAAIKDLFKSAAAAQLPIMVFVGNSGCIQIHTGTVNNLVDMKNWFNVMDPDFNLHLNMNGVEENWIVKKPTADGIVTSIEVFSPEKDIILQCFGKRKPGKPELQAWRDIVAQLAINE